MIPDTILGHGKSLLRRVGFKATPTPSHPRFWEAEVGWLAVWLHAESAEEAVAKAEKIVGALPYELTEGQAYASSPSDLAAFWDSLPCEEQVSAVMAGTSGLGVTFRATDPGQDPGELGPLTPR